MSNQMELGLKLDDEETKHQEVEILKNLYFKCKLKGDQQLSMCTFKVVIV